MMNIKHNWKPSHRLIKLIENNKGKEVNSQGERILLSSDIKVLGMSVRMHNALKRAGYDTVDRLIDLYKSGELYYLNNVGVKTVKDTEEILKNFGLID